MIDPTELRIGNMINFAGEPLVIGAQFIADLDYWKNYPERQDAVSFEEAEPIPLTPEWLERFGLYKPHDQFYWTFNDKELCKLQVHFTEGKRSWYVYWNGAFIGYREHVHEFQNLVKELTGQELKTTE